MARTRLQASRSRRAAGSGNTLDRLVTRLAALLSRLNNPADLAAQLAVAAVLLVAEAALCLLIIRKVPCEPAGLLAARNSCLHYLDVLACSFLGGGGQEGNPRCPLLPALPALTPVRCRHRDRLGGLHAGGGWIPPGQPAAGLQLAGAHWYSLPECTLHQRLHTLGWAVNGGGQASRDCSGSTYRDTGRHSYTALHRPTSLAACAARPALRCRASWTMPSCRATPGRWCTRPALSTSLPGCSASRAAAWWWGRWGGL